MQKVGRPLVSLNYVSLAGSGTAAVQEEPRFLSFQLLLFKKDLSNLSYAVVLC